MDDCQYEDFRTETRSEFSFNSEEDLELENSAVTCSFYAPLCSDVLFEEGMGTFELVSYRSDQVTSHTGWTDSSHGNQRCLENQAYYLSDNSNGQEDDIDNERWRDFVHLSKSARSPNCGLCVVGNLKTCTKKSRLGTNPTLDYPHWSQKACLESKRSWNRCISTNTLISRRKESLKGTGRWLLDHSQYTQWIDQPCAFLWLCGKPGAGKSVLMSTIIHDLDETRRARDLVAYYFANGYYRGVSTTKAILCSMLGQFLFREPIRKSFAEVLPLLNELIAAGNMLSSSKMIWLLTGIRHMIRKDEILYLLLDGLDEATDSPQEKELVLELIDHVSRYDPIHQIKCLISSRSTFFGAKLPKGSLRVDMDSPSLGRSDMSLYVQESLQKSVLSYPSRDNNELTESLLNSAAGSFLVLRLILEATSSTSGNNDRDYKNLVISLNDVSDIELAAIYGKMLARIKDHNKEAALSMLRWVTFAARPLEFHELLALYRQTGIEIKEDDISTISAGLLVSSGNQIRFTHLTVREYLESELRVRWDELSEEANEMIAHACLKTLTAADIFQSLSLSAENLPRVKGTTVSGFMPYARTHWRFHCQRGEKRSTYLAGMLHDILEQFLITSKRDEYATEEKINQTRGSDARKAGFAEYPGDLFKSLNIVDIVVSVGAGFGFTKLTALELDMGADIDVAYGPEHKTPLCLAAEGGHLDVVNLLLRRGADPNISTPSGMTPMAYAMANGHIETQDTLFRCVSRETDGNSDYQMEGLHSATQDYLLTTLMSSDCKSCEGSRIEYELRAVPAIMDEGKILPPILVSGETVSGRESAISIGLPYNTRSKNQPRIVKWFEGAHMHRILSCISKRGMEDVRRALVAAGNDKDELETVITVSKLLSRSMI